MGRSPALLARAVTVGFRPAVYLERTCNFFAGVHGREEVVQVVFPPRVNEAEFTAAVVSRQA